MIKFPKPNKEHLADASNCAGIGVSSPVIIEIEKMRRSVSTNANLLSGSNTSDESTFSSLILLLDSLLLEIQLPP